jgi:CDP-diacylglycerol--glycerol-3-phosphate 3-phosphatidyltransferase
MAVATPPRRLRLLNWPNILTLARLGLSVVLFACIAAAWWPAGLVVFCVAAVTDWLDGYLARLQNLTSALGRNLDPLVDKVLVCGAFIFLLPVPAAGLTPWMVTVVVGRELIVTGLRGFMETIPGVVFGADWLGKLKMGLQCAVLIAVLLLLSLEGVEAARSAVAFLAPVTVGLTYVMLVVTVLSGVQYLWRAVLLLKEP